MRDDNPVGDPENQPRTPAERLSGESGASRRGRMPVRGSRAAAAGRAMTGLLAIGLVAGALATISVLDATESELSDSASSSCAALLGAALLNAVSPSAVSPSAVSPSAGAPALVPGTPLEASARIGVDTDGDGLCDAQEAILGSDPFVADSDEDGYSDAEEFARQSDPNDPNSVPLTVKPSSSITARGERGLLRLLIAVHEPAGMEGDTLLRIGVLAGGQVFSVPLSRLLPYASVSEVAASGGSYVTLIDVPVDPNFVHLNGSASFFTATGSFSAQSLDVASKVDIISDDGLLLLQVVPRRDATSQQPSQGGGTIRRPLPIDNRPPPEASWVSGAVCYQRSEVIGINGPRMLHRIIEADCVDGWDTFCTGDCNQTVGDTYETLDPWSLLGS